jgi:hypothetical protein
LANRAAHCSANLRGNLTSLPRELAAPLLFAYVVVESPHSVHIAPSLADNYSSLSGFSDAERGGRRALLICHWSGVLVPGPQGKSDQLKSDQLKEEHMMSQSRGAVSFEPLFTAEDIGLRKEANVEHVMKVFITLGEGLASRWIEMPKGVLLLQTVPDNPASGAIYLYDRELQVFYFVVFDEGRDDSLTAAEFDELVTEYNLVSWTAHPALLRKAIGKPGMS